MSIQRRYEVRKVRLESGAVRYEARSVERRTGRVLELHECSDERRAVRVAQAMRTLDLNAAVTL